MYEGNSASWTKEKNHLKDNLVRVGKNTAPKTRSFLKPHANTILGKCLIPTFCLVRLSHWTMMWIIIKLNPQQLLLVLFTALSRQANKCLFRPERKIFLKTDEPLIVNSLVPEVTHSSGKWGKRMWTMVCDILPQELNPMFQTKAFSFPSHRTHLECFPATPYRRSQT